MFSRYRRLASRYLSPRDNPLRKWVSIYRLKRRGRRFIHFLRIQKGVTTLLGPKYVRSRQCIEIALTYLCNLKCYNCDMSSAQAPGTDHMDVSMIRKFIADSVERGLQWKKIRLLGGEPTLHPQILEICQLLIDYKNTHAPECRLMLVTNGYQDRVKRTLAQIPSDIIIENTAKTGNVQPFKTFNLAPVDSLLYTFADYTNGCTVTSDTCGIGLTSTGYYPCVVAGGIDRVFGMGRGMATIPDEADDLEKELEAFCRVCGNFRPPDVIYTQQTSPTWQKAYDKYNAARKAARTLSVKPIAPDVPQAPAVPPTTAEVLTIES